MSFSKIIGCGMLFIMCLISASMAQDEIEDMQPPYDQEALLNNVQGLLRSIQSMLDPGNETVSENANLACRCSGVRCRCCQRVRISKINFNQYCCATIVYLIRNRGFRIRVTCGVVRFSKEVSLTNPPKICIGIPVIKRGASICLQLSKLSKHSQCVHGCASLIGRLFYVKVATVNLGCFDIYLRDKAAGEPKSALEPPSFDTFNWIGTQQDTAAMPDFDDDMVMMENIEQPL